MASKIFKPRRGKVSTMAGTKATTVLAAGEMFVEVPDTGVGTGRCKMKIGDGSTAYSSLPTAMGDTTNELITYTSNTATTVATALNSAASGSSLGNIIAALKQAISLHDTQITQLSGDIDTLIKVVAWSNPSQGSNFAGQTIALSYNVSNYTSYELIWKYEPNAIQYVSSGKLQIGSGHLMIGMASNCFITLRGLNIMSNKQATFGDGVYVQSYGNSYTPVSNNYCIPMYIYLYK